MLQAAVDHFERVDPNLGAALRMAAAAFATSLRVA
jgi:hypothetical protein